MTTGTPLLSRDCLTCAKHEPPATCCGRPDGGCPGRVPIPVPVEMWKKAVEERDTATRRTREMGEELAARDKDVARLRDELDDLRAALEAATDALSPLWSVCAPGDAKEAIRGIIRERDEARVARDAIEQLHREAMQEVARLRREGTDPTGAHYRAYLAIDDIRCAVLDSGHPLGDDSDPELTPLRLVKEVLACLDISRSALETARGEVIDPLLRAYAEAGKRGVVDGPFVDAFETWRDAGYPITARAEPGESMRADWEAVLAATFGRDVPEHGSAVPERIAWMRGRIADLEAALASLRSECSRCPSAKVPADLEDCNGVYIPDGRGDNFADWLVSTPLYRMDTEGTEPPADCDVDGEVPHA